MQLNPIIDGDLRDESCFPLDTHSLIYCKWNDLKQIASGDTSQYLDNDEWIFGLIVWYFYTMGFLILFSLLWYS